MTLIQWLASAALVLLPVQAWGDVFIFNAITDPMTGVYIPVDGGHFPLGPDFMPFCDVLCDSPVGLFPPGVEAGDFNLNGNNIPCDLASFNYECPDHVSANSGIAIYDPEGDLLALMATSPVMGARRFSRT